ncbi:MAG: TIM barrel protein [Planctomycetes bacterium]|nr:TIM barrel protein [Planctomycetota bacterium]
MNRREFLQRTGLAAAALAVTGCAATQVAAADEPLFKISLAEWSFHKRLFKQATPHMDHLDFPAATKALGIDACEYVNQFFKDKAKDEAYLGELKKRCASEGIESRLIMCDGEGAIGDPDDKKRTMAVENHYKWVDAAKFLGCFAIRVNAQSNGSFEEQQKLAADGLARLTEYGAKSNIAVIVENHGGLSSNGQWLAGVMKMVNHPLCGTLPDFGNFHDYDRYKGVDETMPFAKAVSAKTHDFDADGNETHTDYFKMLDIVVKKHNYHSFLGIEYEGSGMSEEAGVIATKKLLERVREKMTA